MGFTVLRGSSALGIPAPLLSEPSSCNWLEVWLTRDTDIKTLPYQVSPRPASCTWYLPRPVQVTWPELKSAS